MNVKKWTKELKQKLANCVTDSDLLRNFPDITLESARRMQRMFKEEGYKSIKKKNVKEEVGEDIAHIKHKEEIDDLSSKYNESLRELKEAKKETEVVSELRRTPQFLEIKKNIDGKGSESTAFIIASDWHIEETVKPESISFLNEFNVGIAEERAKKFFSNALRLTEITGKETRINRIVLGLLGDFITGNIHLETVRELGVMNAILKAKDLLFSGIKFLLDNSSYEIVIPCTTDNHSRLTPKIVISDEVNNNISYFLYHALANEFKNEPRVKFLISEGYHLYMDVYGKSIRMHHGHHIKFGGGVGGIYVPISKAISQWNKAKKADLDIIAHFHQFRDGGNFIVNGSLIGYNSFALSIKAEMESPRQAFFLFHERYGKTIVAPIFC